MVNNNFFHYYNVAQETASKFFLQNSATLQFDTTQHRGVPYDRFPKNIFSENQILPRIFYFLKTAKKF